VGENITVTGVLTDANANTGISGAVITFEGTGAAGLVSAITGPDGHYSFQGPSPNSTDTLWTVEANFAEDTSYDGSSSLIETFDTAPITAGQFQVPAGSPSHVELAGFGASIDFENVVSGGSIFVSNCQTPASHRYLSLDKCLLISSGVDLEPGSFAHVEISYNDKTLPSGHSADEIEIFHEALDGFVDITESRDLLQEVVTGRTTNFSGFVLGVALHEAAEEGALRQELFVGRNELVFNEVTSKTINFDESRYSPDAPVRVTVTDPIVNLNSFSVETLATNVTSSSDRIGITLTLTETAIDSGIFTGAFRLGSADSSSENRLLHVRDGDTITGSYLAADGAPFKVVFNEVTEAGIAELVKFHVNTTPGMNNPEFDLIGDAYQLRLIDAQLDTSAEIAITTSYLNVELTDDRISENLFRLLQVKNVTSDEPPRFRWTDITMYDQSTGAPAIDTRARTLSGSTSFLSQFAIGHNPRDPGTLGGGPSLPGAGVVLDFVARVVETRSGGGGGGGGVTELRQMTPGQDVVTTAKVGSEYVTVRFDLVESATGQVQIESQDIAGIKEMFDEMTRTTRNEEQGIVHLDYAKFSTAGKIFDIDASKVDFKGMADITIPYDEDIAVSSSGSESKVRFLHYNAVQVGWEDATVAIDNLANTVTGRVDVLSPVVAAVVDDGKFGDRYFEVNPAKRVGVSSISMRDSTGAEFSVIPNGEQLALWATLENMQRTNQTYMFIVEVFDNHDVVTDISVNSAMLGSGKSIAVSNLIATRDAGFYDIKIFIWNNLEKPEALADAVDRSIQVT
jgi:hypothetical protein